MKRYTKAGFLPLLALCMMQSPIAGAASPAAVQLGLAGNYAIVAGSTITNTGNSVITGNIALSPGARSAVTGFIGGGSPATPGIVNGTISAASDAAPTPATLTQTKMDLTTAYNDAAGRSLAPIAAAGNLGGQTLIPGLYKSSSSLEISSGDLTLDAGGDANAVFIFQTASALTTTSGRKVILIGGAQACNIFWQVGTSATFGTNSVFAGTVMADQSISMTTGASINGRLLARIGAVTLDTNSITQPSCTGASSSSVSSASSMSSSSSSASSVRSSTSSSAASSVSSSRSSMRTSSSKSSRASSMKSSSSTGTIACVKLPFKQKRGCFIAVRATCKLQFPAKSGLQYAQCLRNGIRGVRK